MNDNAAETKRAKPVKKKQSPKEAPKHPTAPDLTNARHYYPTEKEREIGKLGKRKKWIGNRRRKER